MEKCKIVFSFDDARYDTYRAIHIAEQYGLKATLNVTTAYVDGSICESSRPTALPAMTREQILLLMKNCHVEIACHGDQHTNVYEDILKGREKLRKWLNDPSALFGFASPCSSIDFRANPLEKFRKDGFLYVRTGVKATGHRQLYRIERKISRIMGLKSLYYHTFTGTLDSLVEDHFLVHSVPVFNDNTVGRCEYIIQKAIENHQNVLFLFHSILDDSEEMAHDTWSWSLRKYKELCDVLKHLCDCGKAESCFTRDLLQ